jgi:hypothetical protein
MRPTIEIETENCWRRKEPPVCLYPSAETATATAKPFLLKKKTTIISPFIGRDLSRRLALGMAQIHARRVAMLTGANI